MCVVLQTLLMSHLHWRLSSNAIKKNCIFHLSSVSLDDISSVRVGRQSEGLKKSTEEQVENRCFSIVFKGRRKNLDLIASSEEEARRWVGSLQKLVSTMNNLSQMQKTEQYPF